MSGTRRRNQVHAYDPDEMQRLRNVPLPARLTCGRCNRNVPIARFSDRQLTDARSQVQQQGRIINPINCQNCTGAQIVEIECTFCMKTKGLEEFARNQRANADTAKCYECTDEQVTRQPVSGDTYENSENAFVTPDSSGGVQPDYHAISGSLAGTSTSGAWSAYGGGENDNGGIQLPRQFQAMSVSGSVPETLIDTEDSYHGRGINNDSRRDARNEAQSRSWYTSSAGTGSASTGMDRHGPAPAASNAGTERTFASTHAERSVSTNTGSNGWARVSRNESTGAPGPVRSPFVRPLGDAQAEVKEDVKVWSDNESDQEEDCGDSDDDSDGDNTVI